MKEISNEQAEILIDSFANNTEIIGQLDKNLGNCRVVSIEKGVCRVINDNGQTEDYINPFFNKNIINK